MALPSSGIISGSQIGTELGLSATNLSLGGMIASSSISNTNPDKYSEFHGYSNVTYTEVYRAASIGKIAFGCFSTANVSVWHDGSSSLPSIGDSIYTNSAGSSTISAGNWPIAVDYEGEVWVVSTTNSSGEIIEQHLCIS